MKVLFTASNTTIIISYILLIICVLDCFFFHNFLHHIPLMFSVAFYLSGKIILIPLYITDFKTLENAYKFFNHPDTTTKFLIQTQNNTFKHVTCYFQPHIKHLIYTHYYSALYFIDKNGNIYYPNDIKKLKPWDKDRMIFDFYDYNHLPIITRNTPI